MHVCVCVCACVYVCVCVREGRLVRKQDWAGQGAIEGKTKP
jgi:hypothetical protein